MSQDVSSLQQEESVSISGGNARLMLMKKLSRKVEVGGLDGCAAILGPRVDGCQHLLYCDSHYNTFFSYFGNLWFTF